MQAVRSHSMNDDSIKYLAKPSSDFGFYIAIPVFATQWVSAESGQRWAPFNPSSLPPVDYKSEEISRDVENQPDLPDPEMADESNQDEMQSEEQSATPQTNNNASSNSEPEQVPRTNTSNTPTSDSDTRESYLREDASNKENDDRDGHELPPWLTFGTEAPVLSIPRDLGIFFEREGIIEDVFEPIGERGASVGSIAFNCMNGTWHFHFGLSASSVFFETGTTPPDFTGLLPSNPNNGALPPIFYSGSITFGDGVNSYTFSSNLASPLAINFFVFQRDFLTLDLSQLLFSSGFSVPITVSGLPEGFTPTSISTSLSFDIMTVEGAPYSSGGWSFYSYITNAIGGTLGQLLGGTYRDNVPFIETFGAPTLNSNAGANPYIFVDGGANTILGTTLAPGEYNPSHSFAAMTPFVCEPLLPFRPEFPVGIDLDGDGIELINANEHVYLFDTDNDGLTESIGWTGADDGMLIYDYDGNRQVTFVDEFQLTDHAPEAQTDLQALKLVFDTNNDNVFDVLDEAWHNFGVWQDSNQNGVTDEGEFFTLDELGILSIGLDIEPLDQMLEGNAILGQTPITWQDGSITQAYDLGLNAIESPSNHSYTVDMVPAADMMVIPQEEQMMQDHQDHSAMNPDIV